MSSQQQITAPAGSSVDSSPTSLKTGVAGRARARVRETQAESVTVTGETEIESLAQAIEQGEPVAMETIPAIIAGHPQVRRLIVSNALRCLGATRTYYNSAKKAHITEPDYQLRVRALEFLADRLEGRPAQALLALTATANATPPKETPEESKAALVASPALREAMRRMLNEADRLAALK